MLVIFLEFIISFAGEWLVDVALLGSGSSDGSQRIALRILVFAVLGAIVGAITLWLFPEHFIRNQQLRVASLVLSPVVAGAVFTAVGRRRNRKGKRVSALETFWPAYTFALALAVARHYWAG
jgi:hypothetical protein